MHWLGLAVILFGKKLLLRLAALLLLLSGLASCALFDRSEPEAPSVSRSVDQSSALLSEDVGEADLAQQELAALDLPDDRHLGDVDYFARAMLADPERNPNQRPSRLPGLFPKERWSEVIPVLPWGTAAQFSSDFGWRNLDGSKDFHGGIDIVAAVGTPVKAVVDGTVVWLNHSGDTGGVIIATASRTYTYWHTNPVKALQLGQRVRAGQVIATIADSGGATHLHYAVHRVSEGRWKLRNDFNAVDPIMLAQEAGLF